MADVVPTSRELEALKVLWRRGRATVREIYGELEPRDGELAYTTALSLLQTMEQKGLVGHESAGKAYAYYAKVRRDSVFRKLAGGFLDQVFDGAMGEYVARALQSRRPSLEELEELEAMIAEAKERARDGTTRRGGSDETLVRDDERLACGLLRPHDGGPGRGGRGHGPAAATGPSPAGRPVGRRRAGDARGPGGITRLAPGVLAHAGPRRHTADADRRRGVRNPRQAESRRLTPLARPELVGSRDARSALAVGTRPEDTGRGHIDATGRHGTTGRSYARVDWTPDWPALAGSSRSWPAGLMLAWLGIGLWQTAAIRRRSRPAPQWSRDVLAHIVGDGAARRTCSSPAG